MPTQSTSRRAYGSGSLKATETPSGAPTWRAQFYAGGRHLKRTWPRRVAGSRDGLTRTQAEERLRAETGATATAARRAGQRLTIAEVGERYIATARRRGRKPSTLGNLESELRIHLVPTFRGRALDAITPDHVSDLVSAMEHLGRSPKTIRNVIGTLSAMFTYAMAPRRRWATENPCVGVELPDVAEAVEIRFLRLPDELDALISHAPAGPFQDLDRDLWLVAAMTGLRQGELVALRWRDVDWLAHRIRVRQNYVRGAFGSPKSRRSTRSVPMADEVGGVLDRLHQRSAHDGDDDLVFAHPVTGGPMTKANLTRRLKRAAKAAGLGDHVFHDLRHTFGTHVAASGHVSMRTLQEWMGHKHLSTTERYADYAPSGHEGQLVEAVFTRPDGPVLYSGSMLRESQEPEST